MSTGGATGAGASSTDGGTGGGAPITPNLAGVAPFGVFFDLSSNTEDYLGITYAWNFDVDDADPTGRFENLSGFVAGHVYEKPGVYKVEVKIYDDTTYRESKVWIVNVTAMGGGEVYVSTSGTPNGAGTIDDPMSSISDALRIYGKPNNTIYLKRGDTFDVDSLTIEGNGPVTLRDYGDAAAPPPAIRNVVGDSAHNVLSIRTIDWRFINLRITTNRPNPDSGKPLFAGGIELFSNSKNNVLLGLDLVNLGGTAFKMGGTDNFIVDCNIHEFGANAFYGSESVNTRQSIIGNRVYAVRSLTPEHVIRLHEASSYFVGFNNFLATDTKSGIQLREMSDKIVVFGNMLDRTTGINPTGDTTTQRTGNHVFDSNVFVGRDEAPPYDNTYPVRRLGLLFTAAHDVVIRNNIFYNYQLGIDFTAHASGPTEKIRMYNNTFVCNDVYCGAARVCGSACQNLDLRNTALLNVSRDQPKSDNFIELLGQSWPGKSDYAAFWGIGWPAAYKPFKTPSGRLLLADWQSQFSLDLNSQLTNPDYESDAFPLAESYVETVDIRTLLQSAKVYAPKSGGPLVGAGTPVGAALDFFGKVRGNMPSIGAIEP